MIFKFAPLITVIVGGFPPLTPACGARKNLCAAAAAVLVFFDRCAFLALLHPPPAAQGSSTPKPPVPSGTPT